MSIYRKFLGVTERLDGYMPPYKTILSLLSLTLIIGGSLLGIRVWASHPMAPTVEETCKSEVAVTQHSHTCPHSQHRMTTSGVAGYSILVTCTCEPK